MFFFLLNLLVYRFFKCEYNFSSATKNLNKMNLNIEFIIYLSVLNLIYKHFMSALLRAKL